MALYKTGIANSTKGTTPPPQQSGTQNQLNALKSQVVAARVIDIILDENHPKFNDVGQWNGIGAILYEFVNQSFTGDTSNFALPYDSQIKTYPLVNELVLLFSLPNNQIGSNTSNTSYFYLKPLGVWNHPHHDAYPNASKNLNPSQAQDYKSSNNGTVRQVTDGSTEINLNSPVNPSQNTFVEKTDIHPLMPYMGDVLMEGRHGQSLRFGSTAKSQSSIKNLWSTSGKNGDPITILRNGQPTQVDDKGWIPINESIKNDLSSIYLTSTQKLEDFKVASELYNSYTTPPTPPSQFTSPQIAFNSDRVVINAKTDSVLLSAQKSIGMSTNGGVNIDATSHYISSNDVRLGSKNATQPVLLGDDTIELLKQLTGAIKDLASILQVQRDYPGGNLATSYNAIAGNVLEQITNPSNGILAQLNNNSLKSKTTKVQ
jgi:hypothetical protein